jgi:hypothetical protein
MNAKIYILSFSIRATYSFTCSVSAVVMVNIVSLVRQIKIVLFFCLIQNNFSRW